MKRKHYPALLFAIVAIVVLWWQWDAWFGDLPEPEYQISNAPSRLFITPGQEAIKDRAFSWVSGEESIFSFELWQDSTHRAFTPEHFAVNTPGGITHLYNVRVNNLAPGQYHCVISTPTAGTDTLRGSFTIPNNPVETNLMVIGDVQDWGETGSARFFEEVYTNFPNADAWLWVGDLIERPHDQWWQHFYGTVEQVAPFVPFIVTPGNHEYQLGGLAALDARFTHTFPMPLNGNKPTNYFVDYPNVRVVVLETNNLLWHIPSSRKWLREALQNHTKPFTIVMGHHGVVSVRRGRMNPEMKLGIRPLLEEMGADIMLQGHDHAYSRNGDADTRPIYITMSSSAKHYPVGNPDDHNCSDSGQRYYAQIRTTKDSLFFTAYREGFIPLDSLKLARKR